MVAWDARGTQLRFAPVDDQQAAERDGSSGQGGTPGISDAVQGVLDLFGEGDGPSSADIDEAIAALRKARAKAVAQEQEAAREQRERRVQAEIERLNAERIEAEHARAAHISEVTSMDLPLSWENAFAADARAEGVSVDSIPDGLVKSIANLGRVDIEYIAQVSGAQPKEVIRALEGSIYQNPDTWGECFYKGWETAEGYLSGNLKRKLTTAKAANEEYDGYFDANVRAIEKVLPAPVAAQDVYVTLGSPWLPPDVIDDFIEHLLGSLPYSRIRRLERRGSLNTLHDESTGSWQIPSKGRYGRNHVLANEVFGTRRIGALQILEQTLNLKTVVVTDEATSITNKSGTTRIINRSETALALDRQRKITAAFREWVWTDPIRRGRLLSIYENRYACMRKRVFDGSFLEFPTMSPQVKLYPYQRNAVARIILTGNTLLAHDVGAGKTYVMVAAGMELRRMGLANKLLYAVPNNIVGQWRRVFAEMYPTADVLVIEPRNFPPAKRAAVLEEVRDGHHDAVVIAYSCLEHVPLSVAFRKSQIEAKIAQASTELKNPGNATAALKARLKKLRRDLEQLEEEERDGVQSAGIAFDELGIDRLFVDEAHNFKNVPVDTKTQRVLGISSSGSKRCADMLGKAQAVQRENGGKGVVLATGTPITNSITDAYVMQLFLQNGELAALGLSSFDSWLGMFAEQQTGFEVDVDTSSYRLATRFARFHNLPELTALLAQVSDFHEAESAEGIPKVNGRTDVLAEKTPALKDYLETISCRADIVRRGRVSRRNDNMLKITGDGRKAALDMRLIDPLAVPEAASKVALCAGNVAAIYLETAEKSATQLVFCDTSTPKAGFNVYDELRSLLIGLGVVPDEIAFVHDAKTESQRTALFESVRNGAVRVLVGSTFKLGLGVNVQDRLVALHHLDVPWRPADMVQREGRMLRQGNMNRKVRIFRYVTEGSFDAYSWQLLETKAHFITELLSGSVTQRDGTDVEDAVLSYAEVKALAVGNPLVKERVETANELMRLRTLQRKATEGRIAMEAELLAMPACLHDLRERVHACEEDAAAHAQWLTAHPKPDDPEGKRLRADERTRARSLIADAVRNGPELHERILFEYQGFSVVAPANMAIAHPSIWLVREGRYRIELGDSSRGYLVRIDNALSGLDEHLAELREQLEESLERERDLRDALNEQGDCTDRIEQVERKLEAIDEELGVTAISPHLSS